MLRLRIDRPHITLNLDHVRFDQVVHRLNDDLRHSAGEPGDLRHEGIRHGRRPRQRRADQRPRVGLAQRWQEELNRGGTPLQREVVSQPDSRVSARAEYRGERVVREALHEVLHDVSGLGRRVHEIVDK